VGHGCPVASAASSDATDAFAAATKALAQCAGRVQPCGESGVDASSDEAAESDEEVEADEPAESSEPDPDPEEDAWLTRRGRPPPPRRASADAADCRRSLSVVVKLASHNAMGV